MSAKSSSGKTKTAAAASAVPFSIHESVIVSLTRKAVSSLPGFIRFSGVPFVSDLADLIGSKRMFDRSISAVIEGNAVTIEISIVAAYGTSFPEIGMEVQKAVYHQITDFTGLTVAAVNVIITDTEDRVVEDREEESETGDVPEDSVFEGETIR